jgi:hypothetical protein
MMRRWWIPLLALGCACKNDKLCPGPDVHLIQVGQFDPGDGNCTGAACDSAHNSPHTNLFPVNGLYSGKCNADRMKLEKKSLEGGHCKGKLDLKLGPDKQTIIGVDGDKQCGGSDLIGAEFEVGGPTKVAKVKIVDVKPITEGSNTYEGYKIALKSDGSLLCGFDASMAFDAAVGSDPNHTPTACFGSDGSGDDGSDQDMYAIAMAGPIYSAIDASVLYGSDAPKFFNLACSGDALAKTRFYDLSAPGDETTAAMRMFTARYFANYEPFTKKGIQINIVGSGSDWGSGSDLGTDIEAYWDATGHAVCITTPRLIASWVDQHAGMTPDQLPTCVQPTKCLGSGQIGGLGSGAVGSNCDSVPGWEDALRQSGSGSGSALPICGSDVPAGAVFSTSSDVVSHSVLMRRVRH